MKLNDKARFDALIDEKEYNALALLCEKTMNQNRELEETVRKLRANAPSSFSKIAEFLFSDLEATFCRTVIGLFVAIVVGLVILLPAYIIIPAVPTGRYAIESCNNNDGVKAVEIIIWGPNRALSPCFKERDQNEKVMEVMREIHKYRKYSEENNGQSSE